MIEAGYARMMGRYNSWQNNQLFDIIDVIDPAETTRQRGAFFGSIQGTLNHLLWGDAMWMARFDGGAKPDGGIADSVALHASLPDWRAARRDMDARITAWAEALSDAALKADLTWFSGAAGREVRRPLGLLVVHMFNHQTHHRGQVHKMLTEAGASAPVSDLFLMPEDA